MNEADNQASPESLHPVAGGRAAVALRAERPALRRIVPEAVG